MQIEEGHNSILMREPHTNASAPGMRSTKLLLQTIANLALFALQAQASTARLCPVSSPSAATTPSLFLSSAP